MALGNWIFPAAPPSGTWQQGKTRQIYADVDRQSHARLRTRDKRLKAIADEFGLTGAAPDVKKPPAQRCAGVEAEAKPARTDFGDGLPSAQSRIACKNQLLRVLR